MTTKVTEEFTAADHDVNGRGSSFPDPVDTGSTARPQDNTGNTEAAIAHAPGVGDVPQAAVLKALLMKLATLPPEVLAQIANEIDANNDVNQNPSGATDGDQEKNLASILSVKEDVEGLFAGETLTEEFKEKATVVFEAAVGARVALIEAELKDKMAAEKAQEIQEAVEAVTEDITDKIDRYLSFAAEQFVNENKVEIEETIQTTVAEEFMKEFYALASKFNVKVPEQELNVVEALSAQIEELKTKLEESLEAQVAFSEEVKALKSEKAFNEATQGLTATQRERLSQLAENVEYASHDEYVSKLGILVESVTAQKIEEKKAPVSVINEGKKDGVPLLEETDNINKSIDPVVAGTLRVLQRLNK